MKTYIDCDEEYPVWSIVSDNTNGAIMLNIPSHIRDRITKDQHEHAQCQEIIRQFVAGERTE